MWCRGFPEHARRRTRVAPTLSSHAWSTQRPLAFNVRDKRPDGYVYQLKELLTGHKSDNATRASRGKLLLPVHIDDGLEVIVVCVYVYMYCTYMYLYIYLCIKRYTRGPSRGRSFVNCSLWWRRWPRRTRTVCCGCPWRTSCGSRFPLSSTCSSPRTGPGCRPPPRRIPAHLRQEKYQ